MVGLKIGIVKQFPVKLHISWSTLIIALEILITEDISVS